MPGSECRKRIANFRNEGLKKQESFGDVEGSDALPKLPLLWNSTFGRLLAAFRGVRSFARYQNRFDKPHRSAGATQAAPLGEEQRHHTMKVMKPKVCLFVRAGLYRGSRGFWKRPYGRPEGPNRYGTLAKLKAMV